MAMPNSRDVTCPLCHNTFTTLVSDESHRVAGYDSDLRQLGELEHLRCFTVTLCPFCRYADFYWDFENNLELETEAREQLKEKLNVAYSDFSLGNEDDRISIDSRIQVFRAFELAKVGYLFRKFDLECQIALAQQAYYVACDLSSPETNFPHRTKLRDDFCALLEQRLRELPEDSLSTLKYSYLAGELSRRQDDFERARFYFGLAQKAGLVLQDSTSHERESREILNRTAQQQLKLPGQNRELDQFFEHIEAQDNLADTCVELLVQANRPEIVHQLLEYWDELTNKQQLMVLDGAIKSVDIFHEPLALEALESQEPEVVKYGVRILACLGPRFYVSDFLSALQLGETNLVLEILGILEACVSPELCQHLADLIETWSSSSENSGFVPQRSICALRNFLYVNDTANGLSALDQAMQELDYSEAMDSVPIGSPVAAAIYLGDAVLPLLPGWLTSENNSTRRWAAHIIDQLELRHFTVSLRRMSSDRNNLVRLQAAKTLSHFAEPVDVQQIINDLNELDHDEIPFALHFLSYISTVEVRDYLCQLHQTEIVTAAEILPMLGRLPATEETKALLWDNLQSKNADDIAGAITGLAFSNHDGVFELLQSIIHGAKSLTLKRRAIFGLARVAEKYPELRSQIILELREHYHDAIPRLRFPVALALLTLGDTSGIIEVRSRASAFWASFDHYDFSAPAIKAMRQFYKQQSDAHADQTDHLEANLRNPM